MIASIKSSGRSVISSSGTFELQLAVDAEAADAAQPIAVRVEELFVEQRAGLFQLRRVARAAAADRSAAAPLRGCAVLSSARLLSISGVFGGVHDLDLLDAGGADHLGRVLGDLLAAFDDDLAGPVAADRIDDVVDGDLAFDLGDAAAVDDLLASCVS